MLEVAGCYGEKKQQQKHKTTTTTKNVEPGKKMTRNRCQY